MKERPILFSTPMVLALLEGRKTQTRRIIKDAPDDAGCGLPSNPFNGGRYAPTSALFFRGNTPNSPSTGKVIRCPYGRPGDQLWVRETTRVLGWGHLGEVQLRYEADGAELEQQIPLNGEDPWAWERWNEKMCEKAEELGGAYAPDASIQLPDGTQFPLTPSIFMPRWASRITLEITDVRAERLHAIQHSEADALAEGLVQVHDHIGPRFGLTPDALTNRTAWAAYARLWNQINGERAWDANPWVWVVSFKRVTA